VHFRHGTRAVIAVAMLVGVYVLALVLVLAILGGLGFVVALAVRNDVSVGAVLAKFGLVALVTVAAIGRGLWAALRPKGSAPPMGVQLHRERQPAMWAEVDRLAAEVGTRAPDQMWLVGAVNAGVSEEARMLGLKTGVRRLYVGAPLMIALTRGQLRSVLAHELGHYSGRHTVLGPVTYRGAESLARVTGELPPRSITGRIFTAYAKLYHQVSHGVNRKQELEADATSVRIAGPATAARAMREVHVVDAAWDYFLRNHVGRGEWLGLRPRGIFTAFSSLLVTPGLQDELKSIREREDWPPTGRYDSHPSLPERLAAIAAQPDPGVTSDDQPALSLLRDPASALDDVESWMFRGSGLEPTQWDDIAKATGDRWSAGGTRALHDASEKWNPGEPITPADLLEVLRRGHTATLVEPLLSEDAKREQRDAAALDIVFAYLSRALVQQDLARFEAHWDGAWPLVDSSSQPIGLLELVEKALNRNVGPLEDALRRLGLDLGRTVDVGDAPPSSARPDVYGALSHLTTGMRYVHLLTLDTGLLLLVLPRKGTLTFGLRLMFTSDSATKQVQQLVAQDVKELLERPGAHLVAWGDVATARARKRWGEVKLQLRLQDGTRRTIRTSQVTGVAGDPWRVLVQQLGERMDWKV
jgi:Zn-dependent protease with chaperone function